MGAQPRNKLVGFFLKILLAGRGLNVAGADSDVAGGIMILRVRYSSRQLSENDR